MLNAALQLKSRAMASDHLTGFVLAGGKSTRMGRDKATAVLAPRGQTLLETALAAVRAVAQEVFIVGSPELYGGHGPAVAGIFPRLGPLGGLPTAPSPT